MSEPAHKWASMLWNARARSEMSEFVHNWSKCQIWVSYNIYKHVRSNEQVSFSFFLSFFLFQSPFFRNFFLSFIPLLLFLLFLFHKNDMLQPSVFRLSSKQNAWWYLYIWCINQMPWGEVKIMWKKRFKKSFLVHARRHRKISNL